MRMRYHDLVGKRVVTADGRRLGRITDLISERQGEALRVTALLVGRWGFVRRIAFKHGRLARTVPPRRIPWNLVARVEKEVHLAVQRPDLEAACVEAPGGAAGAGRGAAEGEP